MLAREVEVGERERCGGAGAGPLSPNAASSAATSGSCAGTHGSRCGPPRCPRPPAHVAAVPARDIGGVGPRAGPPAGAESVPDRLSTMPSRKHAPSRSLGLRGGVRIGSTVLPENGAVRCGVFRYILHSGCPFFRTGCCDDDDSRGQPRFIARCSYTKVRDAALLAAHPLGNGPRNRSKQARLDGACCLAENSAIVYWFNA